MPKIKAKIDRRWPILEEKHVLHSRFRLVQGPV